MKIRKLLKECCMKIGTELQRPSEERRVKNKEDSFKIFVGCFCAFIILLAYAVINGLVEVYL